MNWLESITNFFAQLSTIPKERLATLVILGLSGFIIWFLYSEGKEKDIRIVEQEKVCSELVARIRENERIDYDERTKLFQKQINDFIIQKNIENDSIYNYFYSQIRKYNNKINKINQELETISI